MNKARLGEPGRGIIQFEILFALRRESFQTRKSLENVRRYCESLFARLKGKQGFTMDNDCRPKTIPDVKSGLRTSSAS